METTTVKTGKRSGYPPREEAEPRRMALIDWGFTAPELDAIGLKGKVLTHSMSARSIGILDNLAAYGWSKKSIRKMSVECPGILSSSKERTSAVLKNFEDRGFAPAVIRNMISDAPSNLIQAVEKTNSVFRTLDSYGFRTATEDRTLKMLPRAARIIGYSGQMILDRLGAMEARGIPKAAVIRMATLQPSRVIGGNPDHHDKFIGYLMRRFSLTTKEMAWILSTTPQLLNSALRTFRRRLKQLRRIGFIDAQIRLMILRHPVTIAASLGKIRSVMANLKAQGFVWRQRIAFAVALPSVFIYKNERTNSMLEVMAKAGVDPHERPPRFILSTAVVRARSRFLAQQTAKTWTKRELFISAPDFEKKFGIGKQEILSFDPGQQAFLAS